VLILIVLILIILFYLENHFLYLLGEEYYVDRYEITNNTTQVIRMTQEIEQREGLGQGQLLNI
jgi:hypothetical protein